MDMAEWGAPAIIHMQAIRKELSLLTFQKTMAVYKAVRIFTGCLQLKQGLKASDKILLWSIRQQRKKNRKYQDQPQEGKWKISNKIVDLNPTLWQTCKVQTV